MPMSDDLPKSLPLTCLNLNSVPKIVRVFVVVTFFTFEGSLQTSYLVKVFVASKTRTKSQQLKQFIM